MLTVASNKSPIQKREEALWLVKKNLKPAQEDYEAQAAKGAEEANDRAGMT